MNKYLFLIILITPSCKKVNDDCNLFEYPQAPGIEWFESVQGSEEESHGHFIIRCTDGGYLQVGETGFISHSSKILVVKTDKKGNVMWKQEFGTNGVNMGNSAIETTDSYIVCGALDGNSALIKLDKNTGTKKGSYVIDNGGSDAFEHIIATSNGFLGVGYVQAQDLTNTFFMEGEGYITFLDSIGLKLYGLNISANLSQAYRIHSLGNHFYISGLTQNAQEYGLLKIDSLEVSFGVKNTEEQLMTIALVWILNPTTDLFFSPAIP